ncbi:hypothetical protein VP01_1843g2 [Puccinia sorghi]|uniref:RNase T2-like C-terminal domain-containing protein n=1 Tax=Puccinia sorghi TaxID=27349 RepID=A0A0L6VDN5_9BASI|nr:hypothetical protein VP01_1843g2 [Puccinia sorghi]
MSLLALIMIASCLADTLLSAQLTDQLIFSSIQDAHHCPVDLPTSCHLPSANTNSCCTNTPGGQLLLTQPDNCDGTYEASCDPARQYHNITQILEQGGGQDALSFMKKYWKDQHGNDETFWQHEWYSQFSPLAFHQQHKFGLVHAFFSYAPFVPHRAKHGTCISTLEPHCMGSSYQPQSEVVAFFNRTVDLFKGLPTYEWLKAANVIPSTTTTYSLDQLQEVSKQHTGQEAVWNCRGNILNEVWWHFNTIGTVADGKFVHAGPIGPRSKCPYKGIQYLPKGHSGGGGGGEHRPKDPGHHPNHPPSSRKHFITIVDSAGKHHGCLISNGNWLSRATCASFSISVGHDKSVLEIRTRKGPCQEVFYSAKFPEGSTQVPILKSKAKNELHLKITAAH